MNGRASVSQIEWAPDEQMLCVSIHDVAPATWSDCLRLVEAVRAVADIPLTWLVVPHYHFRPEQSLAMEACLNVALERGDELALHGYSHLDTEAGGGGLRSRFLRNVYTRREGEFSALTETEARRRLELGVDWFAARGWTPTGFVPPAWLLGEGAWRALRDAPFAYTTTFSHFHCLPARERGKASRHHHDRPAGAHGAGDAQVYRGGDGASHQYGGGTLQSSQGNQSGQAGRNRQFDSRDWTGSTNPGPTVSDEAQEERSRRGTSDREGERDKQRDVSKRTDPQRPFVENTRRGTHAILSPSLVYAARNSGGRILSRRVADATAAMLARSPLVRFSLHPPDARYPELVRHIQQVLEHLLERREAVTKAEFASRVATRLTSMDPTSRPASSPDPSRSSPEAVHSAADRTSYSD
jgi:predicted deacetylase